MKQQPTFELEGKKWTSTEKNQTYVYIIYNNHSFVLVFKKNVLNKQNQECIFQQYNNKYGYDLFATTIYNSHMHKYFCPWEKLVLKPQISHDLKVTKIYFQVKTLLKTTANNVIIIITRENQHKHAAQKQIHVLENVTFQDFNLWSKEFPEFGLLYTVPLYNVYWTV